MWYDVMRVSSIIVKKGLKLTFEPKNCKRVLAMTSTISRLGYDVKTVDEAKDGLLCSECKLILKEAVQTSDGVRLCQQCYNRIKQ